MDNDMVLYIYAGQEMVDVAFPETLEDVRIKANGYLSANRFELVSKGSRFIGIPEYESDNIDWKLQREMR
jgi:hypothetical protein